MSDAYLSHVDPSHMLGKTLTKIEQDGSDELRFHTECGHSYKMYHAQDCCESVWLEDIAGDLDNLIGSPLLQAEDVSSESEAPADDYESSTWTFYKFATVKGYVTLRWCGQSNGYYSERVDLVLVAKPEVV